MCLLVFISNKFHYILSILLHVIITEALHVVGTWSSTMRPVEVIAKFGFQQTNPLDAEHTRGFVYGNVSSWTTNEGHGVLLIVPESLIKPFLDDSVSEQTCNSLLQNISSVAFDAKCFPKGRGDMMRWVPCPSGKLCVEEEIPEKVVAGSQLTFRIEEPSTPRYWFVVLMACYLDSHCMWSTSAEKIDVQYDLWLTNGSPETRYLNSFGHQFSFEEQDSTEMYILFLTLYLLIASCQWRSVKICNHSSIFPRHHFLNYIIALKTFGFILHCLNVVIFSFDGKGILFARLIGEMARLMSVCLLCLLLLLLSSGWSFGSSNEISMYPVTVIIWGLLSSVHFLLFFINFFFVDDILQDIDVFKSWPGYAMIIIRMIEAFWFLLQIRRLIDQENDEEKAIFIAHFGAGFLVWFVYILGLGIIASFISDLWRFKMILAITTIANFTAVACLVHLFWPTSPNRIYFLADDISHRRFELMISELEDEDFENLLISTNPDADDDSPVSDIFQNLGFTY